MLTAETAPPELELSSGIFRPGCATIVPDLPP